MKKLVFLILVVACMVSCKEVYEHIEDFATSETVYPGKYDTIFTRIGLYRIELDLLKAGRIPSDQVNLGKAVKTVVEVAGEDKPRVWNEVRSWVNIDKLNERRLYQFKVYTLDEYDNQSVPVEIAAVPFTEADLVKYDVVPSPKVSPSPLTSTFSWKDKIETPMMKYVGLTYRYKNRDGEPIEGFVSKDQETFFHMKKLNGETEYEVEVDFHVVPLIGEEPIVDTLLLKRTYTTTTGDLNSYLEWLKQPAQARAMDNNTRDPDESRRIGIGWTTCPTIFWKIEADPTQVYTVVKYTDYTDPGHPVDVEVQTDRREMLTKMPGHKPGEPIKYHAVYSPPESDEFFDAIENVVKMPMGVDIYIAPFVPGVQNTSGTFVAGDYLRVKTFFSTKDSPHNWKVIYSPLKPVNDGFQYSANTYGIADADAFIDGIELTYTGYGKPGKNQSDSDNRGNYPMYLVIDLKYPTLFNAISWRHRGDLGRDNSSGLYAHEIFIYGANEYNGEYKLTNPPVNVAFTPSYIKDDTQWELIGRFDFRCYDEELVSKEPQQPGNKYFPRPLHNPKRTPIYPIDALKFQENTKGVTYRYLKVLVPPDRLGVVNNIGFNDTNNNAFGFSEFYVYFNPTVQ